jgi:hypothetical protein
VLALAVAAVGLPVNHFSLYVLLLVVAVVVFTGEVTAQGKAWLAAIAIVAVGVAGQWALSPPRIDEGHNVFLPDPAGGVLQRALPPPVYARLAAAFDAQYPPAVRCKEKAGCWRNDEPAQPYAFSADGIFHGSDFSRAVAAVDFADPVWLRLGFVNERRYNWGTVAPDVHRLDRDGRFFMGLARWHLAMPWFEVIRLPAAYAGGQLCWRGEIMWEGDGQRFASLQGPGCRTIAASDAGHRVFGLAVKPDTLAMHLTSPWQVRLMQGAQLALMAAAIVGALLMLVRVRPRRTVLPFVLIGLAMLVIAIDDASFLGGIRPFDGGDDGLFYDGVGRIILQKLLDGDIYGALQGGEDVFYYGGPGLRYFRALEHVVFGESYLGYLSLVLLLPLMTYWLAGRFLPRRWAIGLAIVFVAVPAGALFGTTFFQYAKWASRGFADPAAYILFVAALLPLLGPARGRFAPAFFAALLFALAVFMKPIVVPAVAVMLGGAGFAALYQRQWARLAGLCIGFLPVFSLALHNWVYGHVFVPLSANAADSNLLVMPPSAWLAALRDFVTLDWDGGGPARALMQIPDWLSGPAESFWTVPLNAAGVIVLAWVVLRGRSFDPWLRLIGAAALAQHAVALFYVATARYHFLSWYLTALVDVVWLQAVGVGWFRRRYPDIAKRLASGLARLQEVSA